MKNKTSEIVGKRKKLAGKVEKDNKEHTIPIRPPQSRRQAVTSVGSLVIILPNKNLYLGKLS